MGKKEFTKKQLRKQLATLNEASILKQDMKKSFDSLKKLDQVMTGQKIGDVTITKSMNKKIKNAKRYIEDLWDKITDGEIEEKESVDDEEVEKKNEQSEGHGKMYNALSGIKEGKTIKMNQSTLKRIVERVIKEQGNNIDYPIAYANCVAAEDITDEQIKEVYSFLDNITGRPSHC